MPAESQTAATSHSADRKTLAKHCVVVIREPIYFGDWRNVAWCTVCQARLDITTRDEKQKLIHKDDCLVAKVELEG